MKNLEEENTKMRDELRLARDQKDEIEQSLVLFEQEIESKRQAMERNAELTVDERFKSKHETIKCYFDS
jgi:cell division septum initiation protein DivIVA